MNFGLCWRKRYAMSSGHARTLPKEKMITNFGMADKGNIG